MERKEFGKYIVSDPKICHGKLTFKGTRIFVRDVVEMVAEGMDWDKINYRRMGWGDKQGGNCRGGSFCQSIG